MLGHYLPVIETFENMSCIIPYATIINVVSRAGFMGIKTTISSFERPFLDAISKIRMSNPNDDWYRSRLLNFAYLLHGFYGGDIDLICVELLLLNYSHDYGNYNFDEIKDSARFFL
jgi:hypothetical protein